MCIVSLPGCCFDIKSTPAHIVVTVVQHNLWPFHFEDSRGYSCGLKQGSYSDTVRLIFRFLLFWQLCFAVLCCFSGRLCLSIVIFGNQSRSSSVTAYVNNKRIWETGNYTWNNGVPGSRQIIVSFEPQSLGTLFDASYSNSIAAEEPGVVMIDFSSFDLTLFPPLRGRKQHTPYKCYSWFKL